MTPNAPKCSDSAAEGAFWDTSGGSGHTGRAAAGQQEIFHN